MLVRLQEDQIGAVLVNTDQITFARLEQIRDSWWAEIELSTGRILTVYLTDMEEQRAALNLLDAMLNGEPV